MEFQCEIPSDEIFEIYISSVLLYYREHNCGNSRRNEDSERKDTLSCVSNLVSFNACHSSFHNRKITLFDTKISLLTG